MKLLNLAAACALLASPTIARELTSEENSAVQERLDILVAGIEESDGEAIVATLPPRVLELIAEKSSGIDIETLREVMATQITESMQSIEIENVQSDLDAADLSEGEEIEFGYAPFEFDLTQNGSELRINNPILIVHEKSEDAWYALRVDQAQLPLLREAYPDLAEIEVPESSASPINE